MNNFTEWKAVCLQRKTNADWKDDWRETKEDVHVSRPWSKIRSLHWLKICTTNQLNSSKTKWEILFAWHGGKGHKCSFARGAELLFVRRWFSAVSVGRGHSKMTPITCLRAAQTFLFWQMSKCTRSQLKRSIFLLVTLDRLVTSIFSRFGLVQLPNDKQNVGRLAKTCALLLFRPKRKHRTSLLLPVEQLTVFFFRQKTSSQGKHFTFAANWPLLFSLCTSCFSLDLSGWEKNIDAQQHFHSLSSVRLHR